MKDIYDLASSYLANRMKTRKETEIYLKGKGFNQDVIDEVLDSFEEYGYLNDIEYVAVFLGHGIRKGKTLWRIKKELELKGVGLSDIENGIQRYTDENDENPEDHEFDRGLLQVQKMIGDAGEVDKKVLARAGRKLVSLGYKPEMVYGILGRFFKKTDI